MTINDFHITYQIPKTIVTYAVKSGLLFMRDGHLIEDGNFVRFLEHSALFTVSSMKSSIETFWKRCVVLYRDKNYVIYDHRRKSGRNYYTVITKDGLLETFSSSVIAKRWAKARYIKPPVKKHKLYHLALTLEQMDWIINSGVCAKRQDIVDKVNHYYQRQLKKNELICEQQ